jgi:hypothetical protein
MVLGGPEAYEWLVPKPSLGTHFGAKLCFAKPIDNLLPSYEKMVSKQSLEKK